MASAQVHQSREATRAKPVHGEMSPLGDLMVEVIRRDHGYQLAQADLQLAGVQLTEAHREILPRLFARGAVQMPITETDIDTSFTGGLFLRFDLIRALLSRNAVTVAKVTREVRREKCRAAATSATLAFFRRMTEVETLSRAVERVGASRELATQASAEAQAMYRAGRTTLDRWKRWEQRREAAKLELQRQSTRLQTARAEAARICPRESGDEAGFLELTETFLNQLSTASADPCTNLVETLEHAPSVEEAKLDLFLAEVGVLEARLERLPSVSLDIGYGQIPVRGKEYRRVSGVVPMVEVTLPLLDMGDIARDVQRAEIHAGQARERMTWAMETGLAEIRTTRRDLDSAKAAVATARKLRDEAGTQLNETMALVRAGSATPLDGHEAAWMAREAEAAVDQAQRDYRLALLAERAACGSLLGDSLREEVFWELDSRRLPQERFSQRTEPAQR